MKALVKKGIADYSILGHKISNDYNNPSNSLEHIHFIWATNGKFDIANMSRVLVDRSSIPGMTNGDIICKRLNIGSGYTWISNGIYSQGGLQASGPIFTSGDIYSEVGRIYVNHGYISAIGSGQYSIGSLNGDSLNCIGSANMGRVLVNRSPIEEMTNGDIICKRLNVGSGSTLISNGIYSQGGLGTDGSIITFNGYISAIGPGNYPPGSLHGSLLNCAGDASMKKISVYRSPIPGLTDGDIICKRLNVGSGSTLISNGIYSQGGLGTDGSIITSNGYISAIGPGNYPPGSLNCSSIYCTRTAEVGSNMNNDNDIALDCGANFVYSDISHAVDKPRNLKQAALYYETSIPSNNTSSNNFKSIVKRILPDRFTGNGMKIYEIFIELFNTDPITGSQIYEIPLNDLKIDTNNAYSIHCDLHGKSYVNNSTIEVIVRFLSLVLNRDFPSNHMYASEGSWTGNELFSTFAGSGLNFGIVNKKFVITSTPSPPNHINSNGKLTVHGKIVIHYF